MARIKKRRAMFFFGAALAVLVVFLSGLSHAGPKRIISLAPSITEILYALGLEESLVGVTGFCDRPEGAKEKPKMGGMSNPSLEAVISGTPDIVLMTTDGNPKEFEERLRSMGIKTYVLKARRINELPDGIRGLGRVLGVPERAEALAGEIEGALKGMGRAKRGLRVLFVVWPEPLIAAGPGTTIDDAIRLLGHENMASASLAPYPKFSLEEAIRSRPDAIVIGRGHGIREASEGLLRRLGSLPAVREGRVYFVGDGLYRVGPRVIEGIAELKKSLDGAGGSTGR